ncbi:MULTISPECIES: cytochrome d ubiquinol oxidase subunit II [Pseudidiomarina]|uniref:Cytochrome bd-I ubiquinol oxidase subunit 2 apoprotein n=2 Tax=Pseudidiomarina TaxID=2800384 RepID=A0A368UKV3_9GAMM|nr:MULTISPECIES: cytochrome d ubiquinol oxidase subunit II [Pseudidiomarina]PWW09314.1 cytochrome bd-I ubiquinol oxidase subunit 2 apoprotein [Pseudidiomarina maritima]RBP87301.1 cytochrome bd-I ubiquinol oxidase subunit 2 apoprotein [Pseudidiomarina tainanensis]RCW29388.1 cytochrome bd-I ubiquinol oxidase subunit 2 apoprotein [Pseudidiomarina tainanensis]
MDYALIWAALISIAVFAYVALDGFDLGIGLLFPWFTNEQHRDRMVNTVAPVWDGNETWLVLGGGGLLAVFPLAYSVLLPALYMPVIAMLQGIDVTDRAYSGGWFDWLSPFTIFAGIAVCIGYMLLGATWLIMKTDGQLQGRSFSLARNLSLLMILAVAAASIYLVSTYGQVADRWLTWPTSAGLWLLPFALAIVGGGLLTALNKKREGAPYLWALGVFLIAFIGFAVSIFPYLIPFEITLWEAAGPDNSLSFLLVGAVILIPIIFAYTGYTYWVFRGKTSEDSGYHE